MATLPIRPLATLAGLALLLPAATPAFADEAPAGGIRLSNSFRGKTYCLEVIQRGPEKGQAMLNPCRNTPAQEWVFDRMPNRSYILRSAEIGEDRCLDIEPTTNRAEFRRCGNYTGQAWHVHRTPEGLFRLTTTFRGKDSCLDVVNGGSRNNHAELRKCGNYAGQLWYSQPF